VNTSFRHFSGAAPPSALARALHRLATIESFRWGNIPRPGVFIVSAQLI
jgi:hypothetical protein